MPFSIRYQSKSNWSTTYKIRTANVDERLQMWKVIKSELMIRNLIFTKDIS